MSNEEISNEEWIKERIDSEKFMIKSRLDRWDKIIPDQIPTAYFGIGLFAKSIALYTLLLGDREESIRWFKKSAENFEKCVMERRARWGTGTLENEAGNCHDLLNSAVLSGDKSVMESAARTSLAISEKFPGKHRGSATHYYYDKTLGHIILGEDDKALEIVDKVNYRASRPFKDLFDGLRLCLEGTIKDDRGMVVEGLNLVLKFHYRKYGKKDPGPADEILCVQATVQIKFASMRGMKIKPEDLEEKYRKHIPWNLFE
jgi:hypothetical protein